VCVRNCSKAQAVEGRCQRREKTVRKRLRHIWNCIMRGEKFRGKESLVNPYKGTERKRAKKGENSWESLGGRKVLGVPPRDP